MLLLNFKGPVSVQYHVDQALEWFGEADRKAKKGKKAAWQKAYQEGAKHVGGAQETGLSGWRLDVLKIAQKGCWQNGQKL